MKINIINIKIDYYENMFPNPQRFYTLKQHLKASFNTQQHHNICIFLPSFSYFTAVMTENITTESLHLWVC